MAEIITTFDTKTKQMTVSVDGVQVADVEEVNMFRSFADPQKFRAFITTVSEDDDNDMSMVTRMIAKESEEHAAASEQLPESGFEDFVIASQEHVSKKADAEPEPAKTTEAATKPDVREQINRFMLGKDE